MEETDRTPALTAAWYDLGALRLHARLSREAAAQPPDLVLVHGLIISSRYMVPTARALAADFRVFAPDLPGFGLSDGTARVLDIPQLADWLLRWMDAAGLERPALLGNSLGCQIAVELAAQHPDRVSHLVITGPTYDPVRRGAVRQIFRWLADCRLEPGSLLALCLQDFWSTGLSRGLRTFLHSLRHHLEERLPEVQTPTLVVRGTEDPIVSREWAQAAARLLPAGLFAEVKGPHCINYSAAAALARTVREFLRPGTAA